MPRRLLSVIIFLASLGMQAGFLAALPTPFDAIPLMLILGLFLIQHARISSGVAWVVLGAWSLDILAFGSLAGQSFAALLAATAASVAAHSWFTNRSFYATMGVTACGAAAFVAGLFLWDRVAPLFGWDGTAHPIGSLIPMLIWLHVGSAFLFLAGTTFRKSLASFYVQRSR